MRINFNIFRHLYCVFLSLFQKVWSSVIDCVFHMYTAELEEFFLRIVPNFDPLMERRSHCVDYQL